MYLSRAHRRALLVDKPLEQRRERLEKFAERYFANGARAIEREAGQGRLLRIHRPRTGRSQSLEHGAQRPISYCSRTSWWAEVQYDHVTSERVRHGTRLLRFRPDKDPAQCSIDQIRQQRSAELLRLTS